jgi:hypothetical protein
MWIHKGLVLKNVVAIDVAKQRLSFLLKVVVAVVVAVVVVVSFVDFMIVGRFLLRCLHRLPRCFVKKTKRVATVIV